MGIHHTGNLATKLNKPASDACKITHSNKPALAESNAIKAPEVTVAVIWINNAAMLG